MKFSKTLSLPLLTLLLPAFGLQAATISGVVRTGPSGNSSPLPGATVTLYETRTGSIQELDSAVSDASGEFTITVAEGTTEGIFYLRAEIDTKNEFLTLLGPDLPAAAVLNELTTVAGAYASAQLNEGKQIQGTSLALRIAAGMSHNLVDIQSGDSSQVMLNGPNADQTNSLRTTRSLANLLAACLGSTATTADFILKATPAGESIPETTALAVSSLARRPETNASELFPLTLLSSLYDRILTSPVDSWVIAVKVNDSGSQDRNDLFGGPANVAFDSKGYAWVANNVVQGTGDSARKIMVLKPDGTPSDGSDDRPVSPIGGIGSGILGVGWGVSVDKDDKVWLANFGWGSTTPPPVNYPTQTRPGNGSVVVLKADGQFLSPPDGYFEGPLSVQAIEPDADGNIWMASLGNDSLFLFPEGDPFRSESVYQYTNAAPFGIGITDGGEVWMTNSGGLDGQYPSSIARFELNEAGMPVQVFRELVGDTLKVVDTDSFGNAWFASQGNSKIYAYDLANNQIGVFGDRGGIDGPWGLCVDGDDNIWVGNFGSLVPGSVFDEGRVSRICGANPATWPEGMTMGDAISPDSGYRVESAGDPVLLNNGDPLFTDGTPSYAPQMRCTSVQIDRAGNLWAFNNWKPPFVNDVLNNPGGDGILIFVGLAPPPREYDAAQDDGTDSDGDGLTDVFEDQIIDFDPNDDVTSYADVQPSGDFDGDGLIEFDEQSEQTGPTDTDTDNDLFSDKQEVDFGSDPLDPDSLPIAIELLTALEFRFSTLPGYTYQVQYSEDLVFWVDVGDPVIGDGSVQSVFISYEGRNRSSEFYRIEVAAAP